MPEQRSPSPSRRTARARTASTEGHGPKRDAAEQAVSQSSRMLRIPPFGNVALPPAPHLAWYVGVGTLAVAEIIEWPIAVVLALGKALADNRSSSTLREFGDALDEAG